MKLFIQTFAAILLIINFNFVVAARLAPGSLPQVKPLQPIPQEIQPNVKNNIYTPEPNVEDENQNSAPVNEKNAQTNIPKTENSLLPKESDKKSSSAAVAIILGLLVSAGIAYFFFYAKFRKK